MNRKYAPLVTLAVLFGACCAFNADFRSPYNLMNIARQVSYSGLLALGMTLVIAGGGIDLSVGSLLALSGVFGLQIMNALPPTAPAWAAFLAMAIVALVVGIVGGALNGALVNIGRIPPFIATLGTFSIYRSLAVYSADAGLVQSSNSVLNGVARGLGGALPLLVLLVAAAIISGILRHTRFGWRICAIGSNEKAATYAASRLQSISSTGAGNAYELDAIACVIIGGTPMSGGRASIWGTLCGVFILGIIGNALDLWSISANLQGTVKGIIIILAVLLQYRRNAR